MDFAGAGWTEAWSWRGPAPPAKEECGDPQQFNSSEHRSSMSLSLALCHALARVRLSIFQSFLPRMFSKHPQVLGTGDVAKTLGRGGIKTQCPVLQRRFF